MYLVQYYAFLFLTAKDPSRCGDLTCDPNADCIYPLIGQPDCICRVGYVGDGELGPNGEPGCEGMLPIINYEQKLPSNHCDSL